MRKSIQARTIKEDGEPRDFIEGYLRALKENNHLKDFSLEITQDFFQVCLLNYSFKGHNAEMIFVEF